MIFLIDQQLPATLARWFESKGYSATHVRDIGMRDAPDTVIWRHALDNDAIVVTKDQDFAVRRGQTAGPRVIWLKIGNAANRALRAHLEAAWPDVQRWLETEDAIVEV